MSESQLVLLIATPEKRLMRQSYLRGLKKEFEPFNSA